MQVVIRRILIAVAIALTAMTLDPLSTDTFGSNHASVSAANGIVLEASKVWWFPPIYVCSGNCTQDSDECCYIGPDA